MKTTPLWIRSFLEGRNYKETRLALFLLAVMVEGVAILKAGQSAPDYPMHVSMAAPLKSPAESELRSVGVTHQDAKFELIGPTVWRVPASKKEVIEIPLKLGLTNCGPLPLRFLLFDTVRVILRNVGGLTLQTQGGRDTTKPGQAVTPGLAPGERFLLSRPTCLSWASDSTLKVRGDDGFGGEWYVEGLVPNVSYNIMLVYENWGEEKGNEAPLWKGRVITPTFTFVLH